MEYICSEILTAITNVIVLIFTTYKSVQKVKKTIKKKQ